MSREEQITQDEDDDEKEMLDHAEGPIKVGFPKVLNYIQILIWIS